MSCSKSSNNPCCPAAVIFQEKICGNFSGGTGGINRLSVWRAPAEDYIEGTFEIFNSTGSPGSVTGNITAPGSPGVGPVPPGNSAALAVITPSEFTITAPPNASGKFCITLYKRLIP
ncbi:hypothetical protein BK139_01675 [Paenibacillus sp. FSL R5-0490]|uniref:S-Ena type endospore appendage n=1 Tax=Bacillales TaxID=1385 RepID=UPI00096CECD6|nr:S-Ena type endospore appendage [Paenibacillus sp. FSL R5-0490]OMF63398.1 hypothetical protein BK139_01675 [Paenibacillus sp. FSL R5-0490]